MELEELTDPGGPAAVGVADNEGGWVDDGEGIVVSCALDAADFMPLPDAYEV